MNTINYLDALKKALSIESDYKLAQVLGVSRACVSSYRKRGTNFDDSTALRAAELLKIDPAIILADMNAERSKTPETRAVWQDLRDRLTHAAAAIFLGVFVFFAVPQTPVFAADFAAESPPYYILCKMRKKWARYQKRTIFDRFADYFSLSIIKLLFPPLAFSRPPGPL